MSAKYKVGDLKAATAGVISVHPDGLLAEATSKMLLNDFSQLPVMSSPRDIKGVISWKTIGVIENFSARKEQVKHYMDKNVGVLKTSDSLLDSVNTILDREFVFIKDSQEMITGIVTIYDIAAQFKTLSEPFIEIESIENSIRKFINKRIPIERIVGFCKIKYPERKIDSVADLTFGEYIGIIENRDLWTEFNINLDRRVLIEKLESVRIIRNQIMHFRVEDLSEDRLRTLKSVSKFFRTLERVT